MNDSPWTFSPQIPKGGIVGRFGRVKRVARNKCIG